MLSTQKTFVSAIPNALPFLHLVFMNEYKVQNTTIYKLQDTLSDILSAAAACSANHLLIIKHNTEQNLDFQSYVLMLKMVYDE
jgi:hypothetical protein